MSTTITGSYFPHYDCGTIILNVSAATFTKAQKRWRVAYVAICSFRVLLSLSKQNVMRQKATGTALPHSHLTVDIQPPTSYHHDDQSDIVPNPDLPDLVPKPHSPDLVSNHALPDINTKLTEMVKEKDLIALRGFGGVEGVAATLLIDPQHGILGNEDDVHRRRDKFGSNTYYKPPPKGLFYFVVDAFKDTTILILLVCAALSLGFGIKEHGPQEGWYEGGSIFVAVFLVISVAALSNFRQERQFDKLSKISNNIKIDVARDGRRQEISIFDIVVGDVVFLNIGDQIPADGLFLEGHSMEVDESSMTGESDHVEVDRERNPFLFSGSKVADGYARMLVTSVGMNTAWGEMMSSISRDTNERTPLQARLDKLTSSIGKVGLAVAFLVLVVLLIRYFTGHTKDENGQREYNGSDKDINDVLNSVVNIVAAAVTIIVVAIPEGLPLAVTLTLAYSMKRMMADHAMVRKLSACETMGSATIICTDKTGTLTMNQMKVTKFWLGQEEMGEIPSNAITPCILELFRQGVGLNTTGSVYRPASGAVFEFSGSPTEKAILSWAVQELGMDVEQLKQTYSILHVETFNSEKKRSGVSMRKNADNTIHVHWKGAAEMVLQMCSNYYETSGTIKSMDEDSRMRLEKIIQGMAASSLRCIAFAYKQISEAEIEYNDDGRAHQKLNENGLTLLGIVGLKDPCRPGVKRAVEICKSAGVEIKMITGDNVFTAKAIATECGILGFDDTEHRGAVCLKQKGEVVAVTGDGTNDAPALKEADIGLSMGIQGTEVAKESSDIVILDDNFTSVATVLRRGSPHSCSTVVGKPNYGHIGSLALATDRPTNELMQRPPVGRTEPLITNVMWRNLLAQALYQIAVLLTLQFKGESIFNVDEKVNDTLIFNTFVLCQVFNEFNARKLEKQNVFKGIHKNKLFLGIVGFTIVLQVVMVEFLKKFADTVNLNGLQWAICIAIAAVSWPIGWIVKFIPVSDKPFLSHLKWAGQAFGGFYTYHISLSPVLEGAV
ncbi:Calcium-transporting ATPase 12, plasma membrane-type [Vitis vinifera]|uniref:Calcium-transporting ATPase n=1 Tax=Vitis vinifera TaxID=29760 RepID=A0A438F3V8_VITVI|nr:Calcium-transporting ATPase 12, plasma membrane-type [Vitis vinifera]